MFYMYILQSETTGKFYIGSTQDIEARLKQHNEINRGKKKSTHRLKGPWFLAYSEEFETRSEAMRREKQLKSWKSHRSIQELIDSW
jgi:putative endonuclease